MAACFASCCKVAEAEAEGAIDVDAGAEPTMIGTIEDTTEPGTPADVNAADTEDVSSGGLKRLGVDEGVVIAVAWNCDWMALRETNVVTVVDELELSTETLREDSVLPDAPWSELEPLGELDATVGEVEGYPCKPDDVVLEGAAEGSSVVDVIAVSGYVGASSDTELDDWDEDDRERWWPVCTVELEVPATVVLEAADDTIPSEGATRPAPGTVDVDGAAAEEPGTALGRPCALSALMISAA